VSASIKLQSILGKILTAIEMYNLRQAIHAGARGLATGKYDEKTIERTAVKICKFIEGAHLDEVRKLESQLNISFIDECRDLIVKAVIEEASLVGAWASIFERERSRGEEETSSTSITKMF